MNPEDNNPLNNAGAPSTTPDNLAGGPNMDGQNGLSMADSLSSAEDNLTSAGLAATTAPNTMGLDQIGATQPEAIMTPPAEEPLIPAAPVPGSIGSAISVPPAPAEPMAAPSFGAPATEAQPQADAMGTGPMPAPEVAPQSAAQPSTAPFNPFANHAAEPAPAAGANPMTPINPAFQPAAPKPVKKSSNLKQQFNTLTLLFAILSALLLITTITFFVMWNNAKNNPKVVYVPQISDEESTESIEVLSCARENDYAYLAGYDHPAIGTENLVASYSNDQLRGVTVNYRITLDDENGANVANENFRTQQDALMAIIGNSFTTEYLVEGNVLNVDVESNGNLSDADAKTLLYGSADATSTTSLEAVQTHYAANGYNCSVQ